MTHRQLSGRVWLASPASQLSHSPAAARRGARLAARCQEAAEGTSGQRRFYGNFVRPPPRADPAAAARARRPCARCQGSQLVPCADCSGSGRLARGGYQKKNPVSAARIIDSKWTAMERTFGWRHFRVTQKRKEGKETWVLMVSTCDANTQFWLNMRNLKERERWAAGWLQKSEIQAEQELAGAECKACGGTGSVPCPLCSSRGLVVEL